MQLMPVTSVQLEASSWFSYCMVKLCWTLGTLMIPPLVIQVLSEGMQEKRYLKC